jgi:hypothetical protein
VEERHIRLTGGCLWSISGSGRVIAIIHKR